MIKRIFALLIIIACFPAPSEASQPISESMVECSVIFDIFAYTAELKGKDATKIAEMRKGSQKFMDHALLQAQTEKQTDPEDYIARLHQTKSEIWENKILNSSDMQMIKQFGELMDWVQYCAKMGKHYGVIQPK